MAAAKLNLKMCRSCNEYRCHLCEEGNATLQYENIEVEYAEQNGMIESQFLHCDACESDFVGSVEGRANKQSMIDFRNRIDGIA